MRSSNAVLVVALVAWSSVQALAQQPPAPQGGAPVATPPAAPQGGRGGPQGPVVVSPQVNAERTMTLRVLAPKATEITVTGEILNGEPAKAMTKGDDGIWTATLRPLPPDVYTYAFNIDGVNTPDPRNPWVKLVSGTGLASQVQVPGDGPQFWDAKPVPHGLLQIMTYESKALGATRQAYVYTPPDYNRIDTRYPGAVPAAWRRRSRSGLVDDRPRAHHHGQPDRREEGEADDCRDAGRARRRQPWARAGRACRPASPRRATSSPVPVAAAARGAGAPGAAAAPPAPAPLQAVRAGLRRRSDADRREDVPRRRPAPRIARSPGSRPAARRRSTPRSAGPICSATSSS